MTDQEAEDLINKLEKEFGDKLPNPEFFPASFMYYVKLYKHLHPESR